MHRDFVTGFPDIVEKVLIWSIVFPVPIESTGETICSKAGVFAVLATNLVVVFARKVVIGALVAACQRLWSCVGVEYQLIDSSLFRTLEARQNRSEKCCIVGAARTNKFDPAIFRKGHKLLKDAIDQSLSAGMPSVPNRRHISSQTRQ